MTPEMFAQVAVERGLDLRIETFAAVRVPRAQGMDLLDLAVELDLFVLGIEGFTRLDDGGNRPELAWIFDASSEFERATPREATDRARHFLGAVPKSDAVFLEFVLSAAGGTEERSAALKGRTRPLDAEKRVTE